MNQNHALELEVAQLRSTLDALIKASKHPHKGPHDTDGTMLTTAALRLQGGHPAGGAHTTNTVARVLRTVATIVDAEDKP